MIDSTNVRPLRGHDLSKTHFKIQIILIILDTVWKNFFIMKKLSLPSRNPHHPGYGLEVDLSKLKDWMGQCRNPHHPGYGLEGNGGNLWYPGCSRNPHHPGYGLEETRLRVCALWCSVAILIILDTVWK